jgi:hypothetical protein
MVHGKTIGIWFVKHKSQVSEVTITPFEAIDAATKQLLINYIDRYQKYLAKEVLVSIVE